MAGGEQDKVDVRLMLTAMAAVMDGERYLDSAGAALLLGSLAPATFRQFACSAGFPKAVKLGKGRKWKRLELIAWADQVRDRQNMAA